MAADNKQQKSIVEPPLTIENGMILLTLADFI